MNTIDWLHYGQLFDVITAHGFQSKPLPEGGQVFLHPNGALLIIPVADTSKSVIGLHYGATVTVLTQWGIMTRDALDLALLQAAHRAPGEPAPRLSTNV